MLLYHFLRGANQEFLEVFDQHHSSRLGKNRLKHPTANNKQPLLLPLGPLNHLVRPLRHGSARDVGPGHAVKLKNGRDPRQAGRVLAHGMQDLEVGVLRMHRGVELVVERHQPAAGEHVLRL